MPFGRLVYGTNPESKIARSVATAALTEIFSSSEGWQKDENRDLRKND